MANARDLMNKSGGGGFKPKPAAITKPVIGTPEKTAAEQSKGGVKPDAKNRGPKISRNQGGAGASVPTSVRPKV